MAREYCIQYRLSNGRYVNFECGFSTSKKAKKVVQEYYVGVRGNDKERLRVTRKG